MEAIPVDAIIPGPPIASWPIAVADVEIQNHVVDQVRNIQQILVRPDLPKAAVLAVGASFV
jgi:hypothetical protein